MNESLIIPPSQNNGTFWKVDQNYWDIGIEGYFVAHGSHNSLICRFDTNQLYQKILIGLIWYFIGSQNTESKTFYIMKTRLISRAEVLGEKSRGQVKVSFARASLPTDFWKGKRGNIFHFWGRTSCEGGEGLWTNGQVVTSSVFMNMIRLISA